MSIKPETSYRNSIERKLPPKSELYRMKNNNQFESGIADSWYSGNRSDLWVEYKYVPKLPVRVNVKIDLSEHQKGWLRGRHAEGRNVAVVIGSPEGGVVFKGLEWENYIEHGIPLSTFRVMARSKPEVAEWIRNQVAV